MKEFFKRYFAQKKEINYLYFGSFFLFLITLTLFASHLPFFFILYTLGQAFIEICLLILIAHILQKHWIFSLFVCISFILLLVHFTQYTIVRVLDTSVLYIIKFFLGNGIEHLITGFQALNLNWTMISMMIATLLFIPLLGLAFYKITHFLSKKRALHLSLKQISSAIAITFVALITLDFSASLLFGPQDHSKYRKILPLGTTLLSPTASLLPLPRALASIRPENELSIPKIAIKHKPNIYFFVIETLRKDFLTAAPQLTAFGNENIQFENSFSNSNSTHLCWYSIFHSDIPLNWLDKKEQWQKGAVPLRYLKKLGYKIHVYSSAEIRNYFQMDKILFGANTELLDEIQEYGSIRSIEPCDRDALAINELLKPHEKTGQAFLIFLDSTHSEYSFPKDFPLQYTPVAKEIDYLTIGPKSPELEHVKNRYRNAISYVDSLMGKFFTHLKAENLYNSSIISITGDHGEEFFEEGALFHGTHLNHYQTSVPIYLKFPSSHWTSQTETATHIDIFPSILHYLTKQSDFSTQLDGKSIFHHEQAPFRTAILHNGGDKPYEFSLISPTFSLHAKILNPTTLEILQLQGSIEPDSLSALLINP